MLLAGRSTSAASRFPVAAHSGALAAGDGAWQALASAHGVHRVGDLAELADTLELFCAGRRAPRAGKNPGLATVHDSGFERAHVADVAAAVGVPFAQLTSQTRERLAAALDPGLEPGNPLDVWGAPAATPRSCSPRRCPRSPTTPTSARVALAVDLVQEYDGDDSYRDAVLAAAAGTAKPVVVLASVPAAIDAEAATRLRAAGVPVLESTRSGLLALGHLLASTAALSTGTPALDAPASASASDPSASDASAPGASASWPDASAPDAPSSASAAARRSHWAAALAAGPLTGADLFDLLRDYGVPAVRARSAGTLAAAVDAAAAIGYPVAIKTDEPEIAHKSDVGGVRLNVADPAAASAAAYRDLAARLGPRVTVCEMAAQGPELILGLARDPALGPLVVLGAGGVLAEYLSERVVALPPFSAAHAAAMISGLRVAEVLSSASAASRRPDVAALAAAVALPSALLAAELGEYLDAFDINPLILLALGRAGGRRAGRAAGGKRARGRKRAPVALTNPKSAVPI